MADTELLESRKARKDLDKAPKEIVRSYVIWIRLVEQLGTKALRNYPGYNDEKLKGDWEGYRSCRLNKQWRVIYGVGQDGEIEVVTV